MIKPQASAYNTYYETYISLLKDDFFSSIEKNTQDIITFYSSIPNEALEYRTAENKWNAREVLIHLIEKESAMMLAAYKAITMDSGISFDLDNDAIKQMNIKALVDLFTANRKNIQRFFEKRNEEQLNREVRVRIKPLTLNALAFALVGHAQHHLLHCEQAVSAYM